MKKLPLIITVAIIVVIVIICFVLVGSKTSTDFEDLSENPDAVEPENPDAAEPENIDVDNLNRELEELDSLDELLDSNSDSEIIDVS